MVSCLADLGIKATTDGTGTVNLPLTSAIPLAKKADFALEVHMNAAASQQANGVETIALPKYKAIAQAISKASANALGLRVRGVDGWIDQSASARGKLGYINAGGGLGITLVNEITALYSAINDNFTRVVVKGEDTIDGYRAGEGGISYSPILVVDITGIT